MKKFKKGGYKVNPAAAPKEWAKFKKWHPLACKSDPMSESERFVQLGWKLPTGVKVESKK